MSSFSTSTLAFPFSSSFFPVTNHQSQVTKNNLDTPSVLLVISVMYQNIGGMRAEVILIFQHYNTMRNGGSSTF